MRRVHSKKYIGFAGTGDAAHPASPPTSQTPSPRRPPPSSRKRDIPPQSEPGRVRRARNVPTNQAGSRRLTIWVFLRPPPIRRPPAGAGLRPAWCPSLAIHRLAHQWSIDASEGRATHPHLPAAGPQRSPARRELEQPALAWKKAGKRDITGAQQELLQRKHAVVRVVEMVPLGESKQIGELASGARRGRAERLRSQTGVRSARPLRQRSATRLDGSA